MLGLALALPANRRNRIAGEVTSALAQAASRRVDVVMIGDSNQLQGGHGFDHGFGKALGERFGSYATPFYEPQTTGDAYANAGYFSGGVTGTTGATSGADAAFDAFALPNRSYLYQSTGDMGTSNGVTVFAGMTFDVNARLRAHYSYGTFDTGTGSFRPEIRRDNSPFTVIATGSTVSTNAGVIGQATTTLDLAAGTRDYPIGAKWRRNTASVGPTIEFWCRLENRDKLAGVSVHTMYGVSGQSAYDMAAAIEAMSDARLAHYFTNVRALQVSESQTPLVVVYINSGFNDRNETSQPSLGPNPSTDADSPEAYIDNVTAIIDRIEGIYTAQGWDLSGLYFLVVPSHVISDPDDSELIAYRTAAETYAAGRERVQVIDLAEQTTSAQLLANGWYASSGADKVHLTQAGYEGLASVIVNSF